MKQNESKQSNAAFWKVMFILVVFPGLMALALRFSLGVPSENLDPDESFALMDLTKPKLVVLDNLRYGHLFFCRFQVEADSLASFRKTLEELPSNKELCQKPISLKLERDWWNPHDQGIGTKWKKGETTLWSPRQQPDFFYAVTRVAPPSGP